MRTQVLIIKNPLRNPRIADLADAIVDDGDMDIVELLNVLLQGIGDDLLDNDDDYEFVPLTHYYPIIHDLIYGFHATISEAEQDEENDEIEHTINSLCVAFDKMHMLFMNRLPLPRGRIKGIDYRTHLCSATTVLGNPITECEYVDDIMLSFKPIRKDKDEHTPRHYHTEHHRRRRRSQNI